MLSFQVILSTAQIVTLNEFLALLLFPPPTHTHFFLSGCLGWNWSHISFHHTAISAHASRSRMAALRGVLWRAVQVRAWQRQSFSALSQHRVPFRDSNCPAVLWIILLATQKSHTRTHAQELHLQLSLHVHKGCAHTLTSRHLLIHTLSCSHIKIASWTNKRGRQLVWHETFPWYHFKS